MVANTSGNKPWLTFGLALCAACARPTSTATAVARPPELRTQTNATTAPEFTQSPRVPQQPLPLSGTCHGMDQGLVAVARELSRSLVTTGNALTPEQLTFELRRAGLPYVWPVVFTASGSASDPMHQQLVAWLESVRIDGEQRCGVAVTRVDPTRDLLVAVVVDTLADVAAVPRQTRVGQTLPVAFQLHDRAQDVSLLALGASGLPREVPVNFSPATGQVRARIAFPSAGRWLLQLLATFESGPRPVAEVEVWVDTPPPNTFESTPVPGEDAGSNADPDALALFAMLNAARQSEQLPTLALDPALSELAIQHASRMRSQQQTSHDVGVGDPQMRLRHYHLPNGVAIGPIGENVARATTLQGAHRVLWQSPAHRQTLLYKDFTHLGIGVVRGTSGEVWVCELFVGPGNASTPDAE